MRFWKKWRKAGISVDDLKKAEMLEAYTCWLKNKRLSRKQKRLLKEINNFPELQPLKQLIDFSHYRFEERENVIPPPGTQQRARERVMAEIRGDAQEIDVSVDRLRPILGSPRGVGNETTEIMQVPGSLPDENALQQWETEQATTSPEMLERYDAIRTLARLHMRFEQKDDDVYVTDLGSSNAPYVDNERVETSTRVEDGSILKCGKISFKVVDIERS
jgi:hypothetical protein